MGVSTVHGVPVISSQRGAYAEVRQLRPKYFSRSGLTSSARLLKGKLSMTHPHKCEPIARTRKSLKIAEAEAPNSETADRSSVLAEMMPLTCFAPNGMSAGYKVLNPVWAPIWRHATR